MNSQSFNYISKDLELLTLICRIKQEGFKGVYTCMISMMALVPRETWILYSGIPMAKSTMPKNIAMVAIPKPQSHPLWSSTYTFNVKLTVPPRQTANNRPLKKLDICVASLGSFSSNWSAPCDGKEALIPALPKANKQRLMNRKASWPPLSFSHFAVLSKTLQKGGLSLALCACTVSNASPYKTTCVRIIVLFCIPELSAHNGESDTNNWFNMSVRKFYMLINEYFNYFTSKFVKRFHIYY